MRARGILCAALGALALTPAAVSVGTPVIGTIAFDTAWPAGGVSGNGLGVGPSCSTPTRCRETKSR